MAAVTCQEIRELFSARVGDALGADERARLDAHLATCADCAREWQGFERTIGLLRAVPPARAPAGFVDRVLAALPRPWYRRLARGLFVPWPIKLPLEAAAIVLVAGLAVLVFQRSPELQRGARMTDRPSTVTAPAPSPADKEPARPSREAPVAASGERAEGPSESKRPTRDESPADVRQKLAPDAPATSTLRGDAMPPRRAKAPPPVQPPAAEPQSPGHLPRANQGFGTESPPTALAPSSAAEPPGTSEARPKSAADLTLEKKDAEGERAGRVAGQVAPAAPQALQKAGEVQSLAAALDLRARLAVAEPAAAEGAVRDVVARAGGRVLARVEDEGAIVLTLTVPGDRWEETQRGLHTLGTLRLEGRSPDAVSALRISLRLER